METLNRPLVTCEAVVSEACYLLRRVPGAAPTVVANIEEGLLEIPFQLARAAPAIRAILRKYSDIPADFADACLIQMADELNTGEILTLDDDFTVYRWRKSRPFELLIPVR